MAKGRHLPWPNGLATPLRENLARMDEVDPSFDLLWQKCTPELVRLAAALGIPSEGRGDLLHDVYLIARAKRPTDRCDEDLRRWLFRVMANCCRLEYRKKRRWGTAWSRLSSWWQGVEEPVLPAEKSLGHRVEQALDRLASLERQAVVLKYFGEFDSQEIGEMLEMPAATVRSHLVRARRQLARDLADWKED
jgi:RNA polymerase sigma factor (sigma-70 family)